MGSFVLISLVNADDRWNGMIYYARQAAYPTTSQPKSLATSSDSTVFVVEVGVVEAIRSNQKVYELKPSFTPSSVTASGSLVAVGGEISPLINILIIIISGWEEI